MTDTREAAIRLVKEKGYERREEPFRLASGALSHDYVDGKYAVEDGPGHTSRPTARISSSALLRVTTPSRIR